MISQESVRYKHAFRKNAGTGYLLGVLACWGSVVVMCCIRLLAFALLFMLAAAYRPAVDNMLLRPGRKFKGKDVYKTSWQPLLLSALEMLGASHRQRTKPSQAALQAKFGRFSLLDLVGGATTVTRLTFAM